MAVSIWGRVFVGLGVIAGILLVVGIIALILNFGARPKTEPAAGESLTVSERVDAPVEPSLEVGTAAYHPTEVAVAPLVQSSYYPRRVEFQGRLHPRRESRLGFEVAGLVQDVWAEVGQAVEQGQPLASLDTQLLEAQKSELLAQERRAAATLNELEAGSRLTTRRAAAAELAAVDAEWGRARQRRERDQELYDRGAISQQEWEAVVSAEEALRQQRTAAEQRLLELEEGPRQEQIAAQQALVEALASQRRAIELQLEKTTLRAPYDGVLVEQYVDQGHVVMAGQMAFDLVQATELEARIGVPPAVADQLVIGQRYRLSVGENRGESGQSQRSLDAELCRKVPLVDPATQTVEMIFRVVPTEAEAGAWVPGRLTTLTWEAAVPTPGYWVPNDALVRGRRGLWSVYEFQGELPDPSKFIDSNLPGVREGSTGSGGSLASEGMPGTPYLGTIRTHQIEVLYSQRSASYVRGTLPPAGWVIVEGAHRLIEGQAVQTSRVLSPAEFSGSNASRFEPSEADPRDADPRDAIPPSTEETPVSANGLGSRSF